MDGLAATLLELFKQMTPAEEVNLARRVDAKGGPQVVQGDDAILKDLLDSEPLADDRTHAQESKATGKSQASGKSTPGKSSYSVRDLKQELHEDWGTAVKNNMEVFEGKFALQQRQLREELSKFIRDENDRILDNINSGPHDLIKQKVR